MEALRDITARKAILARSSTRAVKVKAKMKAKWSADLTEDYANFHGGKYHRWILYWPITESVERRTVFLTPESAIKCRDELLSQGYCAWVREAWLDSPDG